jgi:Arc/MetJ-type ribon-helix-helix transcriptional regulator
LGSSSGRQERMRRIKVSFEDSEFKELKRLVEERGSSYSQFIREAVRRMLEQEKEREEKEREAIERMEAVMEEHMLRTVRTLELLRDEVGLMGSGLQEVKEKLSALAEWLAARDRALEELREELRTIEGAVARLEEVIGLLREEVSELRRRVPMVELNVRDVWRRGEGAVAKKDLEAQEERREAVAVGLSADELPSFIKDNPWVEILSKKGRS